jgi:hypothetical protein
VYIEKRETKEPWETRETRETRETCKTRKKRKKRKKWKESRTRKTSETREIFDINETIKKRKTNIYFNLLSMPVGVHFHSPEHPDGKHEANGETPKYFSKKRNIF